METGTTGQAARPSYLDILDELEELREEVADLRAADPWVILNEAIAQDRACEARWDAYRGRKKAR